MTPSSSNLTEERRELAELIAAAQDGRYEAQREIVRRYTKRLGAFVRPLVGRRGGVEDVVQVALTKAFRRLGALRETAAFESWLFALARNTALDFLRRERVRPVLVADDIAFESAPDAAWTSSRRVAEITEALTRALPQLSPLDRSLVAQIVHGHSYRTVATRAGLTIGAVKLRLHRLRPFLRSSVADAVGLARRPRLRLVPAKGKRRPGLTAALSAAA